MARQLNGAMHRALDQQTLSKSLYRCLLQFPQLQNESEDDNDDDNTDLPELFWSQMICAFTWHGAWHIVGAL